MYYILYSDQTGFFLYKKQSVTLCIYLNVFVRILLIHEVFH